MTSVLNTTRLSLPGLHPAQGGRGLLPTRSCCSLFSALCEAVWKEDPCHHGLTSNPWHAKACDAK
jgi:hypothetical protein